MQRLFGGRFAVEVVFLIAVPIAAVAAGLSALAIILSSVLAYGLVVAFETLLARGALPELPRRSARKPHLRLHRSQPAPAEELALEPEEGLVQTIRRPTPAAEPEPGRAAEPEPEQEPEPEAALNREPEPEPTPEAEAEEAEPEAEPEAALYAVPEPEVEPESEVDRWPEPEPEPWPEPAAVREPEPASVEPELAEPEAEAPVVPIGSGAQPRRWNVWELERLTRESAGVDPARDEERTFLLMYLREFADSNGELPIDFDGLVRESFAELVGAG